MAHLNESGLQAHSVGDLYPWTIVGTQTPSGKTAWFAWNTIDDTRFPVRATYKDAELDVARYALAVQRGQKAAEAIASAEVQPAGQGPTLSIDTPLYLLPNLFALVCAKTLTYDPALHGRAHAALHDLGVGRTRDLRLGQLESFLSRITNP